jgi:formylglycine-generating enzyme required for sulfatase activity
MKVFAPKNLSWLILLLPLAYALRLPAQDATALMAEKLKTNVVAIRATFADGGEEKGFGFITGEEGGKLYLATAAHVVRGENLDKTAKTIKVKLFNDLRWFDATYVYHWDEDDLAVLELTKPSVARWKTDFADFTPVKFKAVRFIGLNGNEPSWVFPGSGEIYELTDTKIQFAIGTIRPGTSGAPLLSEKGILGLITKDDSGNSEAIKISRIKERFSNGGQYPYFKSPNNSKPNPTKTNEPVVTWSMEDLSRIDLSSTTKTYEPVSTPTSPTKETDDYGMIPIKGGTFTMGCTDEQGSDCNDWEKPAHQVKVGDFQLGKYEVTQAQWKKIIGSNPIKFLNCDKCPVEQVNWNDIQVFLRKLNSQTGKNYRLPTEAEWEYAARGGNKSAGYKYSGSDTIGDVAWFKDNSSSKTHVVGGKKANELGLYDMSGNVWEWCQDNWHLNYQGAPQDEKAWLNAGSYRMNRGGSFVNVAWNCRVSIRDYLYPSYRYYYLGFRLAL